MHGFQWFRHSTTARPLDNKLLCLYLRVVNCPILIAANSDTKHKLSTSDRNTNTQRMRSRRVRRCHHGGLLLVLQVNERERVGKRLALFSLGIEIYLFILQRTI